MKYEVGDKVKIVKRYTAGDFHWNSDMDSTVGKTVTVKKPMNSAGSYKCGDWWYLPQSLELVESKSFVLPDEWCIKITPENKSIVNTWKSKQEYNDDLYENSYRYVQQNGGGSHHNAYPEITFDQFKKHVLKESVVEEVKPIEDRWFIRLTPENREIVGGYYDKRTGNAPTYSRLRYDEVRSHNVNSQYIFDHSIHRVNASYSGSSGREITTEEFCKLAGISMAKPASKPTFKKDDWVVVLEEDSFYSNCEQGKAQQIVTINTAGWISLMFSNGDCNCYQKVRHATQAEIDAVSKPKKPEVEEGFKIGDYVEVLYTKHGYKEGDIGVIKDISHPIHDVFVPNRVSTSRYKPNVSFSESQLKLSTKEAYELQSKHMTPVEVFSAQASQDEYYEEPSRDGSLDLSFLHKEEEEQLDLTIKSVNKVNL